MTKFEKDQNFCPEHSPEIGTRERDEENISGWRRERAKNRRDGVIRDPAWGAHKTTFKSLPFGSFNIDKDCLLNLCVALLKLCLVAPPDYS